VTKNLNFDFFKVNMPPDADISFEKLLKDTINISGKDRTFAGPRYHIRLHAITPHKGILIGEVAKIRMTDIPEKMRLTWETDPIDLDADQGLGETATFLYVPSLEVIIYQRNRDAVSYSAFCIYLEEMGDLQGTIDFDIIFEIEALRRLDEMKLIRRFDVQIAAPGNSQIFADLNLSPKELTGLMNTSPKIKASFSFSMGHQKGGSLLTKDVVDICKKVFKRKIDHGAPNEDVKLLVSGKGDADANTEVIDLFHDRMKEHCEVDLGSSREISREKKQNIVYEVWKRRKSELKKMFSED